ncbi:MAG: SlyX family protein [Verrucomicrobiota bacterium]
MAESIEERLVKIESHLAHVEKLVEELNGVVVEQGKQIARLQSQQQQIAATVESQELERIRSTNAKPPHYQ